MIQESSVVILVLEKVMIGNSYSRMLGLISYELYLIHFLVIDALEEITTFEYSDYVFTVAIIIISLILASIFHWVSLLIRKMLETV